MDYQKGPKDGKDIINSLQRAIQSGDYSRLNQDIQRTVESTVNEVVSEVVKTRNDITGAIRTNFSQSTQDLAQKSAGKAKQIFSNYGFNYNATPAAAGSNMPTRQASSARAAATSWFNEKGSAIGFLQVVIGRTLGFIFGFSALAVFFAGIAEEISGANIGAFLICLLFCLYGVYLSITGSRKLRIVKKARRYRQLIGEQSLINISMLANLAGETPGNVLRDLQEIIRQGNFSEAHLDSEQRTLILTHTAYREYIKIEEQRKQLKLQEEMEKSKLLDNEAVHTMSEEEKAEWVSVVNEGESYIARLKKLNDDIPGEVISAKLEGLEHLLKEIFERVRVRPAESRQMRKFMEYYLPTTVKLVEKYKEFDLITSPSREVLSAKQEIENTLDTINQAFNEMLNNLFKNDVYDAASDAQVLKTMLAHEGLTKDSISGR